MKWEGRIQFQLGKHSQRSHQQPNRKFFALICSELKFRSPCLNSIIFLVANKFPPMQGFRGFYNGMTPKWANATSKH